MDVIRSRTGPITVPPLVFALALSLVPAPAPAQEALLTLDLGDEVEITHRWSYTTRVDGRYRGHTSREASLFASRAGSDAPHTGELMVSQDTIRGDRTIARRLAERGEAEISFSRNGEVRAPEGQRAPLFRGVPRFPDEPVAPGTVWQAPGVTQFYIEGDRPVAVPVLVEYTYDGTEEYKGQRVHRVTGLYAVRAPLSRGQLGSHPARDIIRGLPLLPEGHVLHGRHEMTILLPVAGGPPIFQRTGIQEQLRYANGSMEERSGFILTWYRSTGEFDSGNDAERIAEQIRTAGVENVAVRATEDNRVSLSIRNLQFVADQAVLLPGEESRLDQIAQALKTVPDRTILVVGHTADVGTAMSQVELSFDRAKKIVDELTTRGIEPGRLFYDGRGGRYPIADNNTPEGRAANRRVEIEILPARR